MSDTAFVFYPRVKERGTFQGRKDINMEELIPISEVNGKRAINARDLHSFLESKQEFANWIKNRIKQYDFIESQDYQILYFDYQGNLLNIRPDNFIKSENQQVSKTDYILSISMAKELSMVEGNERGKQARKYFIACEERLQEISSPSYLISDPIKRAEKWIEEEKARQQLALSNEEMKPKAEYFNRLVDRNLLTNIRDTAKQIHVKEREFVALLIENRFLYRDAKGNLKPYAKYVPSLFELKDFERGGHTGTQLLINPKGKETFRLMFGA